MCIYVYASCVIYFINLYHILITLYDICYHLLYNIKLISLFYLYSINSSYIYIYIYVYIYIYE